MTDTKKQSRVLVNVLGIPLLLSAIYIGGIYFQCFIFIAIFISTLELKSMCLKKEIEIQIFPMFLFYVYLFLTHFIEPLNMEVLFLAIVFIVFLEVFRKKNKPIENIAITIFGIIWIGLFMNCIVIIRNINAGMEWTLMMFLSVWICDSAAFFFGSKFGKAKILPNISPNKTWLGTISGIVFVFILIFSFTYYGLIYEMLRIYPYRLPGYYFLHIFPTIIHVTVLSLIFGGIGQVGDFLESMIKRQFKIKDSGTSLRGHGGFLDRMDSLMLAAPSFYLYLKYVLVV